MVGGYYWSRSLGRNVRIVKKDKDTGWFLDKEGVGWTVQGRRLGEEDCDLEGRVPA